MGALPPRGQPERQGAGPVYAGANRQKSGPNFRMHLPPLVLGTIASAVIYNRLFAGCNPQVQCAFPALPKPTQEVTSVSSRGASTKAGGRATTILQRPSGAARRKAITRCRVLRGEIRKWETEFELTYRRKPGDADKEAARDLYHEYRKLKQIIRGEERRNDTERMWNGDGQACSLLRAAFTARHPKLAGRACKLQGWCEWCPLRLLAKSPGSPMPPRAHH